MKPRFWLPWVIGSLILLFLFVGVGFLLVWGSYPFGWEWTGIAPYTLPNQQYQRSKTLWDLLHLLPHYSCFPGHWRRVLHLVECTH